ncbi:MFS transporter [Actinomadura craniellae]|uniref:MFS transporter n=1 Tax=Actinomadura craniellae TaxID=2231787 RepID=A0A365GVM1_9ACTN|nr:MFS transporter [Actinomadura craniellae]RAY10798.1 MFS transporter [Actinomadura craniellae]
MPDSASSARPSPRLIFGVLSASAAGFAMLQSLVGPVLPTIQRELGTDQATVTWVLTAWLLSASVATPLMGRIGDMAGKKRTLLAALGAIALGNLVAALAPNIGVLIVARVIQGFGGAVLPMSFGIMRDELPAARLSSAVGGLSAVIAVGGGLGTVLAGPIVATLGWRWLFWLPMIAILATAYLAHRFIPESPVRTPGRVGWLGALLLSGWLVTLLVPLSKAPAWGWGSGRVIALLVLAVVLFAAWLLTEVRSRSPLVDMRMMRLPAVWTTNLVALLFGAGMFSVIVFLPQFMQIPTTAGYGFGASITQAGLLMLPMLVTMGIGGFLSGPLAPVADAKAQLVGSAALSVVSCVAFAAYHDKPWQLSLAAGIFGLGLGLAYAAMTNLVVRSVPPHQTGIASGMNTNIRTVGGSIGTAVTSSIVTGHLQPGGLPEESGFTHGFLLMAVISAATVAVALLIPATRRAGRHRLPSGRREPVLVGAAAE